MRNMFLKNKHTAPCRLCGHTVQPGEGQLFAEKGNSISFERKHQPTWAVQHIKKCPARKVAV